ncbi:MAG: hypothetical protein QOK40_2814 [Miltoncostaeaceae bacterium]|jgi:uncharacterized protein YbjT (DUF2867 family)|nr:hypothetical protein [Miltoncostaeaceae bacterium]
MILVSGATGTVGREVAGALGRAGAPVRALVRDPERARALLGPDVELAVGDFARPASLRAALAGVDRVLLVAPLGPRLAEMEAALVAAASGAGVRHVVKLSTLGVTERPGPDGAPEPRQYPLHRRSERLLERSGMAWTHLRPGPFMQNLLGQAAAIAGDGTLRSCWGAGRVAPVDARDVSAVAVRALLDEGHEGHAHALPGPEALSGPELAARLAGALDRPVRYVDLPPEAIAGALRARGASEWMVGALLEVMARVRDGAAPEASDAVGQLIGRPPRRLEEFVRDHASSFGAVAAVTENR